VSFVRSFQRFSFPAFPYQLPVTSSQLPTTNPPAKKPKAILIDSGTFPFVFIARKAKWEKLGKVEERGKMVPELGRLTDHAIIVAQRL